MAKQIKLSKRNKLKPNSQKDEKKVTLNEKEKNNSSIRELCEVKPIKNTNRPMRKNKVKECKNQLLVEQESRAELNNIKNQKLKKPAQIYKQKRNGILAKSTEQVVSLNHYKCTGKSPAKLEPSVTALETKHYSEKVFVI